MISSSQIVYALGLLVAAKVLMAVYKYFVRPGKNLKKYGEWAVVTGATDGIGEAIALELAKKGLNIVLVSRNYEKLKASAAKIEEKAKVETKIVEVDFSDFNSEAQNGISKVMEGVDVGVLVNNVGMSYPYPRLSLDVPPKEIDQLWALNMHSVGKMTSIVLPGMVERRRGAIVNISSTASTYGAPMLSYYGATKAYVNTLSRAMNAEYSSKGVSVQAQTPSLVVSKLSKIRKPSLTIPTAAAFAKASVRFIGYEPVVTPYWVHALQDFVLGCLPENLVAQRIIMPMHRGINKRALQKLQKER